MCGCDDSEGEGNAICHVSEIVRRLSGGSQPVLVNTNEGFSYIVKLKHNPQGTAVLFNELVTGRIAKLLGVSVPDCCLAAIGSDIASQLYFETPTGRRPASAGLHFASKRVLKPFEGRIYDSFPERWAPLLRNSGMLAGFALLNVWLHNIDTPQLLYWRSSREKKFTVTSIDHGHYLGGPEWRLNGVMDIEQLSRYSYTDLKYWHQKLSQIPSETLFKVFEHIPEEWGCADQATRCGLPECLNARRLKLLREISALSKSKTSTVRRLTGAPSIAAPNAVRA